MGSGNLPGLAFKILKEEPEVPGVHFWCNNQKLTLYPAPAPKPGVPCSSPQPRKGGGATFSPRRRAHILLSPRRRAIFLLRKWRNPSWSTFCARLTNKNNKNRIKFSGWLGLHFWLPPGRCSFGVIFEVFPMQNTNSICDLGCSSAVLSDAKHE